MVCLYITSMQPGGGKTLVCAGLGSYLLGKGKKVGFFKPVFNGDQQQVEASRRDGLFMKQVLGLDEPVDVICPVTTVGKAKDAYSLVAAGKDVVITESAYEVGMILALDARVIAVEGYDQSPGIFSHYNELGEHLLGVIVNKAAAGKLGRVRDEVTAQLKGSGVAVLGVLPEDRLLFTLTIGELAEAIGGEILNSSEQSAELVENFMMGALTVDPGPEYYGRKSNKAVVVRGERTDMQLAALETSTRCLVLCGGTPPAKAVSYRAEVRKAPIILTKGNIMATVESIEQALGRGRFNQERKLPRLAEIMERSFNFQALAS